jgi:hypothetical protein
MLPTQSLVFFHCPCSALRLQMLASASSGELPFIFQKRQLSSKELTQSLAALRARFPSFSPFLLFY